MTKQEFEQFNIDLELSGMTIKSFMSNKGLPLHRYYYWKKKYNEADASNQASGFIQIGAGQQTNSTIRIEYPTGVVINFQLNPGTKTLLKLIKYIH
jgi:hypothetical protein